MEAKQIDLHMHSHYSDDGEYSPSQLVEQCREQGIKIMAIADHNCVRANEEGEQAARAAQITYIPAIEVDCTWDGVNFHVLGYGIDYKNGDFKEIEDNIDRQSQAASGEMLHLTQKLGFSVTEEDMDQVTLNSFWKNRWTGEMFAEVLLSKPEYLTHPMLKPYRIGGERSDNPFVNFYWDYYSQGKPCYVKMEYPDLAHVVEIIHRNSGVAVLAHPAINLKSQVELLEPIIRTGMDGIEAFSSYHSLEQARYYYEKAQSHGLLFTCGSDYHGKTKPSIPLGGHGCTLDGEAVKRQLVCL